MGEVQSREGAHSNNAQQHSPNQQQNNNNNNVKEVKKENIKNSKEEKGKELKDVKKGKESKEKGEGGQQQTNVNHKLEHSKNSFQEGLRKVDAKLEKKLGLKKKKKVKSPIIQRLSESETQAIMGVGKRASRRTLEGYNERRERILATKTKKNNNNNNNINNIDNNKNNLNNSLEKQSPRRTTVGSEKIRENIVHCTLSNLSRNDRAFSASTNLVALEKSISNIEPRSRSSFSLPHKKISLRSRSKVDDDHHHVDQTRDRRNDHIEDDKDNNNNDDDDDDWPNNNDDDDNDDDSDGDDDDDINNNYSFENKKESGGMGGYITNIPNKSNKGYKSIPIIMDPPNKISKSNQESASSIGGYINNNQNRNKGGSGGGGGGGGEGGIGGYSSGIQSKSSGGYSSHSPSSISISANDFDESSDEENDHGSDSDNINDDDGEDFLSPKDIPAIFQYLFTLAHDELYRVGKEVDVLLDGQFLHTLVNVLNDLRDEKKAFGNSDEDTDEDNNQNNEDNLDDSSIIESEIAGTIQCDWNMSFQNYVSDLKHFGHIHEERMNSFVNLSNLALDFVHCAKMYGRIIISEVETPVKYKTIKPIDLGGVAGGDKYKVNNILFKFARDRHNLFDDEDAALKIAGHDLKGLIGYYNLGIEDLHFPLMALVDYLGYRLIAMSVLPITKDTIVYGSGDAGRTMQNSNAVFADKMKLAAKLLNLKPHFAGAREENQVEVYSAADLEGHSVEGHYYLLDFSRAYPPTLYDHSVRNGNFYQLFRIEFIKKYKKALSPDVYSGFTKHQNNNEDYNEIEEAFNHLKNQVIPLCAKYLDSLSLSSENSNLIEIMHEYGINLRYFGFLRREVRNEAIRRSILLEMIGRVIKHQLRSSLRSKLQQTKVFLDHAIREVVVEKLNLIFGSSRESEKYFDGMIKPRLLSSYPSALTDEEKLSPLKRLLKGKKDFNNLFNIVQRVCLLEFSESSKNMFSKIENSFQMENPFHLSDLERVAVRVRHMNIIALALGYVLKNQARELKQEGSTVASARLCKLAIEKFKVALSDYPSDKRALREMADTLLLLGEKNSDLIAEEYYIKALQVDAKDVNTMFKYAVFLEERDRFKEAEDYYLKALEIDPFNDHCLQRYGHFLEAEGNLDAAEALFISASEARSNNASTYSAGNSSTPRQMGYFL